MPNGLAPQPLIFTIHVIDLGGNRAIDPGGYHYVTLNTGTSGTSIVNSARLDIGMPYNTERRPYCGSYGPWSSRKGVCTDLVIDAYLKGTGGNGAGGSCGTSTWAAMGLNVGGVNLEALLRADGRAHRGRYTWNSARNANDLRIYFQHNQIFLNKNQPWQIGDVVFFDWNDNGTTDHVGIVSGLDGNGNPTRIVHAPGGGTSCDQQHDNACETNDSFMRTRWGAVQGHGRLTNQALVANLGLFSIANIGADASSIQSTEVFTGNYLEVALNQPDPLTIQMTLRDGQGRYLNGYPDETLFGSITDDAIPYLPYSEYEQDTESQTIRYYAPTAETYQLEFNGGANTTYSFSVRTYQGATLVSQQTFTKSISVNENQSSLVTLVMQGNGTLAVNSTSPTPSDHIDYTTHLTATVNVNAPFVLTWNLTETTGLVSSGQITATISPLVSREGDTLSITGFVTNSPTLNAGQSVQQHATITLGKGSLGAIYEGSITVYSASGKKLIIPVSLTVNNYPLFLPVVRR